MAQYKKGATLSWRDLWIHLGLIKDNAGRWYPGDDTPQPIAEYCYQYRSPSRAWPLSYAKPLLTTKFAKWLTRELPELAIKLGVADDGL